VSTMGEHPRTRSAEETLEALARIFDDGSPELAFEAVVDGRDAAVAVDAAGRRLVVVSTDGTERSLDLSSGGTIQRLHRNGSVEARIETAGQQITLFDLVDWDTADLLTDVLRLRGFRSESPSSPPPARGRYPRLVATSRRGVPVVKPPATDLH